MMVQPANIMQCETGNGVFSSNGIVSSHGSTDRSSASPSNADDLNDLMEDDVNQKEEYEETLSQRIQGLEDNFVYIQHQLSSIMSHLHAVRCTCKRCARVHTSEPKTSTDPSAMLTELFPNASSEQLKTLLELSKMNKLPSQVVREDSGGEVGLKLGQSYSATNGGGKVSSERVPEAKKIRKVGFPPPVSTYYQRKDNVNQVVAPTPLSSIPNLPSMNPSNTSTISPGPSSDGDREEQHMDVASEHVSHTMNTSAVTPTTPGANLFTQSMVDMLKLNAQNAAHSTGSPGFLRGRGRGRPKLIGDELDADLVDYMVSLKNADPHGGHFTASQALHMARQYILERAPGLLEEHGGHVKLKLTWAMKLVSRIGERQKEIEFGLPAGTLSNMGRNLTNLPGGNFMADVMAQNILSQHMMMVNQFGGSSSKTSSSSPTTATTATTTTTNSVPASAVKTTMVKSEEVNGNSSSSIHNEENLNNKLNASTIPEIVDIKELNIPFLNNFLAELNEKNSGLIDGEIGSAVASSSSLFAPNA